METRMRPDKRAYHSLGYIIKDFYYPLRACVKDGICLIIFIYFTIVSANTHFLTLKLDIVYISL